VKFEVHTAVTVNITLVCSVTSYSLVDIYQCVWRTCCLHLQGSKFNPPSSSLSQGLHYYKSILTYGESQNICEVLEKLHKLITKFKLISTQKRLLIHTRDKDKLVTWNRMGILNSDFLPFGTTTSCKLREIVSRHTATSGQWSTGVPLCWMSF
jgi:hypothetical protein